MAKKMNRRNFFRRLSLGLMLPLGLVSYISINKSRRQTLIQKVSIHESELINGLLFEGVLVSIQDEEIQFLSAQCSHLGCEIKTLKEGKLICPCHGSQFDLQGHVLKGPAAKNLSTLKFDYLAPDKIYLVDKSS